MSRMQKQCDPIKPRLGFNSSGGRRSAAFEPRYFRTSGLGLDHDMAKHFMPATILKRHNVVLYGLSRRTLTFYLSPSMINTADMSYRSLQEEGRQEAAEPLYGDSDEDYEKRSQQDADLEDERRKLQASVRRLRAWLIAVSIALGIACLYTLYTFRGTLRDHKATKRLSFAPPST